jgi:hypothetical protein
MASIFPSFSSNNPFHALSNPWTSRNQQATTVLLPLVFTPARPTDPYKVQPHQPRPYVPGGHCVPTHGFIDESNSFTSVFTEHSDPSARHPPRPADQYESVSSYIADHGPVFKALTLNPGSWKEEDKLSMERGNYQPWAKRLWSNIGIHAGATRWLDPTSVPPSIDVYPRTHQQWLDNDVAVQSYISLVVSSSEQKHIQHCSSASAAWVTLCNRHTHCGPLDQVNKLHAAMAVQFSDDPESWAATLDWIAELKEAV